jgi:hypothetical protein
MAGNYYGSGIKQKVGKMREREGTETPLPRKKLRIPPKRVA